mgnify:CR=1 FL=1
MSYDIYLRDRVTKETVNFDTPHQMAGGTYAVGGTTEAWLNVTYNYAQWYYKDGVFQNNGEDNSGIRSIYGLSGAESIPVLEHAIKTLESMTEDLTEKEIQEYKDGGAGGYWTPTRANAIRPLYQLLAMAKMRPDAEWSGD